MIHFYYCYFYIKLIQALSSHCTPGGETFNFSSFQCTPFWDYTGIQRYHVSRESREEPPSSCAHSGHSYSQGAPSEIRWLCHLPMVMGKGHKSHHYGCSSHPSATHHSIRALLKWSNTLSFTPPHHSWPLLRLVTVGQPSLSQVD